MTDLVLAYAVVARLVCDWFMGVLDMIVQRAIALLTMGAIVLFGAVIVRGEPENAAPLRRDKPAKDDPRSQKVRALVWRADRTCALNCAYLMLRCYDKPADYLEMENELIRQEMSSVYDIKTAVGRRGLKLAIASLTPKELRSIPLPAIAHWEVANLHGRTAGHFVVVVATDEANVTYVDGTAAETMNVTWRDFQRKWTGVVAYRQASAPRTYAIVVLATLLGLASPWVFSTVYRITYRIKPGASESASTETIGNKT